MKRRVFKFAAGAIVPLAALSLAVTGAVAQTWPSRAIQVIVPFSPGSATDIIPRTVMEQVSAQLGQPIIVENRPGAGSAIGTAMVARANPDGYTLLATSNSIAATPAFQENVGYNPLKDFAAVAMLGDVPLVLVISPDKHIKTVQELVAYAKAHPGALNYASAGLGSATYMPVERFRMASGWTGQHVPFKGAPEALTEVMTGRVDIYYSPLTPALPLIKDGRLVPLAVAGGKRTAVLPDVPTTLEAGYPESDSDFWSGLFAPAKTPREIIERLHAETMKALAMASVKDKLTALGVDSLPLTMPDMSALVAREVPINVAIAKATGNTPAK